MNIFHSCAHGLTLLVYSILTMASASANALKLTSFPEEIRSSSCFSNFSHTVGGALCQILQSRSTWERIETSLICCLSSPQHQVSSVCKQQKSVDSPLSLNLSPSLSLSPSPPLPPFPSLSLPRSLSLLLSPSLSPSLSFSPLSLPFLNLDIHVIQSVVLTSSVFSPTAACGFCKTC